MYRKSPDDGASGNSLTLSAIGMITLSRNQSVCDFRARHGRPTVSERAAPACRFAARASIKLALAVLPAALAATSGCQVRDPAARAGIEVNPPSAWTRAKASSWMVPGVPLAAWSGPYGASLVLYRTLPVPGGSAASLAVALANRLENLPELSLRASRTETVAGVPAARVEVVAPGTGGALAPSGTGPPTAPPGEQLVPTHQITFGFVRPGETLYLSWHLPEASYDRLAPDIQATLESLHFTKGGTSPSYSK
jgi:hypothetical protein